MPCSSEMIAAKSSIRELTSSRNANRILARVRQRRLRPGLEGRGRGLHGGVHVGGAGQHDLGLLLAGGRVPHRAGAGRATRRGLAADPVRDGPQCLSSCAVIVSVPSRRAEQVSLLGFVRFIGLAGLVGAVQRGDLGDRDVPPALRGRHRGQRVGLDVDGRGLRGGAGSGDRVAELLDGRDPDDVGAEALGVGGQVDRQFGAVEHAGVRVAIAVVGAKPLRSEGLRERADRGEPVVLHDDQDQLDALGDRGDDLLGHHQVGAVADQRVHVAFRGGHLDPQRAGDLVAHAGVGVLHVVLLRVLRPPEHLQVTGHRPGRLHHHRVRTDGLVQRAQHLGLRGQRLVRRRVVGVVDDAVPFRGVRPVAGGPGLGRAVAGERVGEGLQAGAGVGQQHHPGVLGRVHARPRSGSRTAPPGAGTRCARRW